ncbi:hypothetical protein DNTS_015070 [Danionella cerebrum]|uniref:C-type lectin domain-containing protein n=1 Tax=Danionella cerebrum TaxID=2873325 RepID=A0A553Q092_9TELE|nr:hypothetical protein DNTS_015070 [Danionella translucida]
MMELEWFISLLFISFSPLPARQQEMNVYYLVEAQKSFTDAKQFCQQAYTDLAKFDDAGDLENLGSSLLFNTAWIGLQYTGINTDWQWSLADPSFYSAGETQYRNWASFNPSSLSKQDCVSINYLGFFYNNNCIDTLNFICYDAQRADKPYIFYNYRYPWNDAQSYCRYHHTDLASVRNADEKNLISDLIHTLDVAHIGLFRDRYAWTDNSTSSFRNWGVLEPDLLGDCVAMDSKGYWGTELCFKSKSFFCYRRAVVEQRLQRLGAVSMGKLTWRPAADETVFQQNERRAPAPRSKCSG